MTRWSVQRLILTVIACVALWYVVARACLLVGSTGIGWPEPWQLEQRWPPVLTASLVGAALAAAGVVFQAILRNPLADPYLLGVSSGASLASYVWRLPMIAALFGQHVIGQQMFTFIGAIGSVSIVFALSSRRGRLEPLAMLLVGVVVNVVNGALFLLASEIVRDQTEQAAFLVGSIQAVGSEQLTVVTIASTACWIVLLLISGQLNIAMLSEAEAESLGLRIHRLRWIALIIASLMTASVVAISGPIGFIGLVCPHLARLFVGNDQRKLLIVATAAGAMLLAIADAGARLFAQTNLSGPLPVGIVTALMGGPFFLLLLWQSRRRIAKAEGM